jgi:hypothetical protein
MKVWTEVGFANEVEEGHGFDTDEGCEVWIVEGL